MKTTSFIGFISPFLVLIACGREHDAPSTLNYIAWPESSVRVLGIADAKKDVIKVCLSGSVNAADLEKAKLWAVRSVLAWQRTLVVLDKAVTAKVQLSCESPTIRVTLIPGRGTSLANGRSISIYVGEGYGTWTHELGHAYAALGDTYWGGIAGSCQAGQPQSLMCWGAFGPRSDPKKWSTLWPDDIKGIQANYRKLVPTSEAPEWAASLKLEDAFDVTAPWPDAVTNSNKYATTELELSDTVARLGSSPTSQAL